MTDHVALALQPINFSVCSVPFGLFVRLLSHTYICLFTVYADVVGVSNSFSFMSFFFFVFHFPSVFFWGCFSFILRQWITCLFYYIPFLYMFVSSMHCIESKRCNHMKWNSLLDVILLIFVNWKHTYTIMISSVLNIEHSSTKHPSTKPPEHPTT